MSELKAPTHVKYFISALYNSQALSFNHVKSIVENLLGEVEVFKPSFNPLFDYYSKEMGHDLERVIFYQSELKNRELLIDYKIKTTLIEQKNLNENKRLVNLDVGYVAKEQVILATGKPYSHRVFLDRGIFAELTYIFSEKSYHSLPWTYPDYAHAEKIKFFNSIR